MSLPEIEWIVRKLREAHIPDVVRGTGLSDPTVRAIADGKNTNPTIGTFTKLENYFREGTK